MRCQICFELGGLVIDYEGEKMRSHSDIHQKQINQDADDIEKIFQFCFPNAAIKNLGDESGVQEEIKDEQLLGGKNIGIKTLSPNKIKIRAFGPMQRQFKQLYNKFGRDGKIACRLCSKNVWCGKSNSRPAIDHAASVHFGTILFTCRFCPKGYKTITGMTNHIRNHHRKSAIGGYVDRRKDYEPQITALLTECFGAKGEENGTQIKQQSRGHNVQPNAVQRHFNELYEKFGRDRKIACRLCSKDVYCGKVGSVAGVNHILSHHFGKILFTCRYCPKGYKTRHAMNSHIIRHHQKTAIGGHVDHGHKYESQIKALLTKCFGMEEEKKTDQKSYDGGVKEIQQMISQKKMKTENQDQINDEEKNSDTIPKTKGNAASGTGKFRYYCDNCDFSTKFEKLMQNHCALFHR